MGGVRLRRQVSRWRGAMERISDSLWMTTVALSSVVLALGLIWAMQQVMAL